MTLDARIAAALRDADTSAAVEAVLADARTAAAALDADIASARVDAMSPLLDKEAVAGARRTLDDATSGRDRLTVALTALVDRAENLREQERQAVAKAEQDAAVAERDELAAAIRADVPGMVRRWTELVRRVASSDARLAAAGVTQSAESVARGYPTNGYWPNSAGPVMRLREAKLPLFTTNGLAWGDTPRGPVWPGEA